MEDNKGPGITAQGKRQSLEPIPWQISVKFPLHEDECEKCWYVLPSKARALFSLVYLISV